MNGKLYVVATPIGNLDDMTARAVKTLAEADLIAAEDTRTSRTLLTRFGINTPTASCHKFNETGKLDYFLEALLGGKNIALISDAGTPCISDPGHRLIARAAAEGIEIVGVSGACAAVTAVSVSGFDAASFLYIGFLPRARKEMIRVLSVLAQPEAPLVVFYESPRRVAGTVALLDELYPGASLCLCNDLTKKFERIYRGSPAEVLAEISDNPHAEKGEYTGVIQGRFEKEAVEDESIPAEGPSLEARLVEIMVKNGGSLKSAVQSLSETCRDTVSKKDIYAASLRLKALIPHA